MARQPDQHENQKSLCMKLFKQLAAKTDLTEQELRLFHQIRTEYILPFDFAQHQVITYSLTEAFNHSFTRVCEFRYN